MNQIRSLYYLTTANHGLALIDDQLFDYGEKGVNLRIILVAVRVLDKI